MLAVCDADGTGPVVAGLDAGAVAVAVAQSWAGGGRDVLVVDADSHGTGLSERVGAAARLALRPARRGLPSLIAARSGLSAESVVCNSWLLGARGDGSVRLLGAPAHPDGARLAAGWLADRRAELARLAEHWAVIVSMPGPMAPAYGPLLRAVQQRLVLTVTAGTAPAGGLRAVGAAFGLRFAPDPEVVLLAAETEGADTDSVGPPAPTAHTRAPLVGGIRRARPAVLMGARPRRRDRVLLEALADVAGRLGNTLDRSAEPTRHRVGANGLTAQRRPAAAQAGSRRVPSGAPAGAGT